MKKINQTSKPLSLWYFKNKTLFLCLGLMFFASLIFIFSQCSKEGNLEKKGPPDRQESNCTTTLTNFDQIFNQLDYIAQAVAVVDYKEAHSDYRLKIDNLVDPDAYSATLDYLNNNVPTLPVHGSSMVSAEEAEITNPRIYGSYPFNHCAHEKGYSLQINGSIKGVTNYLHIPDHANLSPSEKDTRQLMVVPNVKEGYISGYTNNEVVGYTADLDPSGNLKVTHHIFTDYDAMEDYLDANPYFVMVIDFTIDEPVLHGNYPTCDGGFTPNDGHCDRACGENYGNSPNDCDPANSKQLRLVQGRIETDYKNKHVTPRYTYRESFLGGAYSIHVSYVIVHANGTYTYKTIDYDPWRQREVHRCKYKSGGGTKCSNGTNTLKNDVAILSNDFNPNTDRIYLMFWEWDLYSPDREVPFNYSNLIGTVSGQGTVEYWSSDPPFGSKPWRHYPSGYIYPTEGAGNWDHLYELDKTDFVPAGSLMTYENTGAVHGSVDYGFYFKLEYDN